MARWLNYLPGAGKLKLLLIILLLTTTIFSQEKEEKFDYGVKGGFIYGGPMPAKIPENVDGSPVFGPYCGIYFDYKLSENISLHPEISLSIKGVNFRTDYRRDTIVETEINGQKGTVPTFYNAKVIGEMAITYLDIPVFLTYYLASYATLYFGAQSSFLIGGKNDVLAHVVVGEGGFYDDVEARFDNYGFINTFDFAFCLGSSHDITDDFSLSFYGTRSIKSFYNNNFKTEKEFDNGKMYNTYFVGSISYKF
jgi:hypothetical protein